MLVALGDNAARESLPSAQALFWAGLCLVYGPIAFRLLSTSASRAERLALVLILGIALFGVKILHSPVSFDLHDELATWRQTSDLLISGHYLTFNPLVEGYAGYPTLESVTAALASLCHINIFHTALIVIGIARATLMLALFLFLERVTGSSRSAGVGVAIYACNPSFLYFDSQFGYESLALPVAASVLMAALLWSGEGSDKRRAGSRELLAAIAILAATLTVTHHMTSYAVLTFLLAWTALAWLADRERGRTVPLNASVPTVIEDMPGPRWIRLGPALPTLILATMVAAWFLFVAQQVTVAELGGTLTGAVESTIDLILGNSGPKTLFQSSGQTNSLAARALALASVVPLLLAIPFGLWRTWRRRGAPVMWRLLAIVGALYPVTLGLRLTLAGTETSQRASEFVFLGLAFLVAILIQDWTARVRRRGRGVALNAALAALATVIFLGGFVVGESPVTRLPGPFLISGESRSVSAQGIAASQFAAKHLPARSKILVDRPNATFLASYAHLNPLLGYIGDIPVASVFFSNTFTPADRKVIGDGHVRYIVVDGRLSSSLPVVGIYFERYEPNAFNHRRPISAVALHKFKLRIGFNRIYSNGPIVIYDTSSLPPEKHAPGGR
ncbi:MAG: hypothetical protein WBM00_03045 [Solirubrobacterales bacterium]